ncbi:single-stranded DNA-binding protein [Pseudomonas sp. HLS-6]|uniref:DUF2528 family protein n=1 Tax=Pseudomonas sp. HLS-6 TaxID=2049589 RepID=UPI000C178451|nr:DUF2528 family protein [Pseudomonas sp. HLS-6]ATR85201.1 single-stranded DNA-binding protein [Pseudomonas sp. HLS-6]
MTTPNIKRFKVKDTWKDYEVTLEVNLDRLTPERAELINSFWTSAEDRLAEEDDDVVRTVIRLAGLEVICEMLEDGGADFSSDSNSYPARSSTWALQNKEGWGGKIVGDEFGWCGIRVVAADVQLPGFEDVALSEEES